MSVAALRASMDRSQFSKVLAGKLPSWKAIDPALMIRFLESRESKLVRELEDVREMMADCKLRGA